MTEYKTVLKRAEDAFVERRSRFIGHAAPVKTEEEAVAFINEMKAKYWDATHNVYAYCLRDGQIKRYSDDSEPQGLSLIHIYGPSRCAGAFPGTWARGAGNGAL